jgi:signal transduction histidine kinase
MSFLNQAFAVINTREGSAIYHILALFALEAAFAIALSHRWRMGATSNATRLALAAGLGGLLRGFTFAIGALGAYGLFSAPAVLAPLDRAVTLGTLMLLGWALVFHPGNHWADLLTSAGLVAVFVAYIVAGIEWYPLGAAGTFYNGTIEEFLWEIAKIAVISLTVLILIILRPVDWGLSLGLFLILLSGVVYHLLDPAPTDNYPAPQRIAEMAALPLFTVLIYRHALAAAFGGAPASVSSPVITQAFAPTFKPRALTTETINALASLNAIADNQDVVSRTTNAVGKTLMADVTLLFNPPKVDGPLACLGAYDRLNERHSPGFIIPADKAIVLTSAISRSRPVRLRLPARQIELNHMADALGLDQIGSALVVPLIKADQNYGAIMIGSISADKEWSGEDQALLNALVGPIVSAIVGNQQTIARADDLQHRLDEAALNVTAARDEIEQLTRELDQVREQARRHQQQAESLASIIKAGAAEPSMTTAEVAALQASYRRALEDLAGINQQLAEAQAEIEKLRGSPKATADQEAQINALAQQLATTQALADERTREVTGLKARLAETQTQLNQLRASEAAVNSKAGELAALNAELTKAQTLAADRAGELTIITAQLAAAQEEVEQLREELVRAEASASAMADAAELAALNDKLAAAQSEITQLRLKLSETESADSASQSAMLLSLIQDLRQPMSSIVGYTDLLLSESVGILGALQRSFLERIKASIERMTGLLNDLVQVTAIDSGRLRLDQQHVSVVEAIEDAFTGVGAQFREKNITLNMDVSEDLPSIEADRDAILQILSRLLNNACAASTPGSQVDVTAAIQPDNFLLVSVHDTGGGIAPGDQPRVFARTYRADRPLIAGLGDTGFGMSIAKALTEAQGGRIWVESQPGVGSTFSVLLPTNFNGRH